VRIEHVALWTADVERLRAFYETHFGARAGERYDNAARGFASYFLELDGGARLELMEMPEASGSFAHLALSLGSESEVDAATERTACCRSHRGGRTTAHRRRLLREHRPRPGRQPDRADRLTRN
jgi:catechol 2,3-dioxygenase-like lactoylglutathione lyase family enzyme